MDARHTMLEAHVGFELDRWGDDGLRETVVQEVAALFVWLGKVTVAELAPCDAVRGVLVRGVAAPLSEEVERMAAEVVGAVHDALVRRQEVRLADLVADEDFDVVVETVVGMRHLRQEVIDQITTSSAYAELISHVLYKGIKDYLVSQNVLARKIPGASSMLRFGQNAVSAAAPGLERSVDRQLTSFISGNVAETVAGSGAFLTRILDDDMIRSVAAELWSTNSLRTVSDVARLVSEPSVAEAIDAAGGLWEGLREAPVVAEVLAAAVDQFYAEHGGRTPTEVLADLGITPDVVVEVLTEAALPAVRVAVASGYVEARVRARLEPFYSSYRGK